MAVRSTVVTQAKHSPPVEPQLITTTTSGCHHGGDPYVVTGGALSPAAGAYVVVRSLESHLSPSRASFRQLRLKHCLTRLLPSARAARGSATSTKAAATTQGAIACSGAPIACLASKIGKKDPSRSNKTHCFRRGLSGAASTQPRPTGFHPGPPDSTKAAAATQGAIARSGTPLSQQSLSSSHRATRTQPRCLQLPEPQ